MSPIRLGNGFWIVNSADEVLDAAFTQMITSSTLKSSRELQWQQDNFKRYQILAYMTPAIYPQLLHISFRDNMRVILEGTALPNQYILDMAQYKKLPQVDAVDVSFDFVSNAVIYRCNKGTPQEFLTWSFFHLTHRKNVIASLEALGYSRDELDSATNAQLEAAMFMTGQGGHIIGTPCISGQQTMIQHVAVTLDPSLQDHLDCYSSFHRLLRRALEKTNETSKEFIVEKNHGYVYRISVKHDTKPISWDAGTERTEPTGIFPCYNDTLRPIQRNVCKGQIDLPHTD